MNGFLDRFLNPLRAPESEGAPGGEGGGDAGAPAGEAAPSFDAFRQVMAFDPFTPPAEKGAEGGEGEADGGSPAGGASPADPAPAAGAAPASPEPPAGPAKKEGEPSDPTEDLRAQVQKFLAKANAPKPAEQPAAQPQPQAPAQPESKERAKPAYDFAIPDQILDGLESEDKAVRRAAYKSLTDGVANKIAADFSAALGQLVEYIHQQVPQQVLSQVDQRQTFDRIKTDLYGAFPELGRVAQGMPAVEQALWGQIRAVGEQMGIKDWTPEFRDGVGRMLHLQLGIPLAPQTGAPTAPQAPAKPPRKGSFSAGGAAGPRSNGADQGNDFMSVLNAGT